MDSNVLARAIRPDSLAAKVLALIIAGPHVLVLSPFLLSELSRILRYPRLRAMHGLNDAEIDAYVQQVQLAAMLVNPDPEEIIAVVSRDPDDDQVVATAVVGGSEVICTRDKDFDDRVSAYCQSRNIQVMTDRALLDLLQPTAGS